MSVFDSHTDKRTLPGRLPRRLPTWLSLIALGAYLVVSAAACKDSKPKYPNCGSDKDCKDGQHCFQKHCSECSEDSHCESWQECSGGACEPRDGKCGDASDCEDGQICKDNTCTACSEDRECGSDAACKDGRCLKRGTCSQDTDCADDEDCVDSRCQRIGRSSEEGPSCRLSSVYFGFDEYVVNQVGQDVLSEVSECVQQGGDRGLLLEGHTDDSGTDEYNIALSEKRGRSVADFLARLGIDPARLQVVPKGETEATATDEDTRAEERRVDFEWK